MAEFRVSQAVSNPGSTVKESARLRKAAEAKLDATEREFNLKHQLHIQRLDNIGSELDSSDLSRLSRQVTETTFKKKKQVVSGLFEWLISYATEWLLVLVNNTDLISLHLGTRVSMLVDNF